MRHLTVETLLEHIEARLGTVELTQAMAHLATCDRCRAQASELEELMEFLERDRENEPPQDALDWTTQLFQPVLRPVAGRAGRILRIAQRVFDSYEQPVAGVRSAGEIPRQLLYRAGAVDVDLRIERGEGRISLAGQLLSDAAAFPRDTPVRLESGGAVRFTTSTNVVGEFSFDRVPEDTYHLSLELPEGDVRLFCVNRPPRS